MTREKEIGSIFDSNFYFRAGRPGCPDHVRGVAAPGCGKQEKTART